MAKKDENGHWTDKSGKPTHPELIRIDERIKDELVETQMKIAIEHSKALLDFKKKANAEVDAFYDLLLDNYGIDARSHSRKGNFTLENFSATSKIEIRNADNIKFDEKLHIAKIKIDEYLHDITKGSSSDIITLITKAFEVDKQGDVNAKKILALKSYDITDERWKEAMAIIDESIKVVSSKSYIRFYTRDNIEEAYSMVILDLAKV